MASDFGLFNAVDILKMDVKREWLIEHVLYEREMMCLAAEKKSGKSVIMQQMAFNLSTGTPFLGHFNVPKENVVLYVQCEGFLDDAVFRYKHMNRAIQPSKNLWLYNVRMLALQDADSLVKTLQRTCDKIVELCGRLDVLIIDPLYKAMCGGNMNDQVTVGMATTNLDVIINRYKCTTIIVHHDTEKFSYSKDGKKNKHSSSKSLMGSSYWGAWFSQIYKLYEVKKEKKHAFEASVSRMGINDKLELRMVKPQEDDQERLLFVYDESGSSESVFQIKQALSGGRELSTSELISQTGITRQTLHAVSKKLDEIVIRKEGNKNYYSLRQGGLK